MAGISSPSMNSTPWTIFGFGKWLSAPAPLGAFAQLEDHGGRRFIGETAFRADRSCAALSRTCSRLGSRSVLITGQRRIPIFPQAFGGSVVQTDFFRV